MYRPLIEHPRIEFDVDLNRVGETDAGWLVEVVASVRNLGRTKAELMEIHLTLESVIAIDLPKQGGALDRLNALSPLFEGGRDLVTLVLDPGTKRRLAIAAILPKTVDYVVVKSETKIPQQTLQYVASKLVRLQG